MGDTRSARSTGQILYMKTPLGKNVPSKKVIIANTISYIQH